MKNSPKSQGSSSCNHLDNKIHPLCGMKMGFPVYASGKEPACQYRRTKRLGFDPWVGKIPWRRAWQPTPGFMPVKLLCFNVRNCSVGKI